MRESDFKLPDYKPRKTEFSGEYDIGDTVDVEGIEIEVKYRRQRYEVFVWEDDAPASDVLWTIVHWCRAVGIPGVWKSVIKYQGEDYRIGALYMIAGFELSERESNYEKYGETPFDPVNEELGYA